VKREEFLRLHAQRRKVPPDFGTAPIQLGMRGDPWRVVVCCTCLTRTGAGSARPAIAAMLTKWPDTLAWAQLKGQDVRPHFETLGLTFRAYQLPVLAQEVLFGRWADARDLPGVGPYHLDALRIFCLGDRAVRPLDHVLAAFMRQVGANAPTA